MFQMGSIGPMLGQAHHFLQYAPEDIEYARNRYRNEANRLYGVLDRPPWRTPVRRRRRLHHRRHRDLAVDAFPERQGVERGYPNFVRWFDQIDERPAVQRGVQVLADRRRDLKTDKAAWEIMFGAAQYQRR